ncbi:MAG TPA: gamma-glutamyl-gamma-aminobutyrate hydrolase family protein [Caulobacteraceae bacterium]|jgi:putative glutamine amidotransferase|nr:gamma-glutamyl-gamma-aminobutyrate hydrolase family protein [Caulobacteraceae bacterium]
MSRPVLGVICCTRTVGVEPAQAVMNRYVAAAMAYGDVAALLIPSLPDLMAAREVAPRLDGLLLTGSPSNVAPDRYGQGGAADAEGPFDLGRDAMTAGLIEAMLELGRPVFGVCRGLQELNVAFGGSLRRDMSRNVELIAHHAPDDVGFDAMFAHEHDVALTPGGVLQRGLGRDRLTVNSVHFQGIDRLGDGLGVEAVAPDGVIEGVSAQVNGAPVVAVQWHPEWRTRDNPDSQAFFRLLGRALRGELARSEPYSDPRTSA